jgi:hypothetical protein
MSKWKHNQPDNAPNEPAKEGNRTDQEVPIVSASIQSDSQKPPCHCECACKQEKSWWDKLKPFVEILGVALIFIYTAYTIKEVHVAQRSSRPFVGVEQFNVVHTWQDDKGQWQPGRPPKDQPGNLHWDIVIKNFGPMPALNLVTNEEGFLNGSSVAGTSVPQAPALLEPSGIIRLTGVIGTAAYGAVIHGSVVLTINLSISYDGPEGHEHECTVDRYMPDINGFSPIGPCPK